MATRHKTPVASSATGSMTVIGSEIQIKGRVEGEEDLRVAPADALASVEVMDAAYRALRDSAWVSVAGASS